MHYTSVMPRSPAVNANALIQTRIDPAIKSRAAEVLGAIGLTVSDAVRILLTRIANEGALPVELIANSQDHDAWFRAKVREALADPRPDVSDADVEAEFAARRAATSAKLGDI
jgi:DNA-damage-inducible protein J